MLKICGACTAALVTVALMSPAMTTAHTGEAAPLAAAVPNDVFLYIAERKNPERKFLDDYWQDVMQALSDSGIGDDLMGMLGLAIGDDGTAEVERLKQRAMELLDGVDWDALNGQEMVFAERFDPLSLPFEENVRVVSASMVWLFRGTADGPANNFDGLVAILEAIAEEMNTATGSQALAVRQSEKDGAQVARLNLLAMVPGAAPLTLSVARYQDIIIIGFREELFEDSLALAVGKKTGESLASNERFRNAFKDLPPAEDTMLFFDMQAMLKPLRAVFDLMVNEMADGEDVYHNTRITGQAANINAQALSAYRMGDSAKALKFIREAYEAGSRSCYVLYNLACFNALQGNHDEALEWLDKAIEGGFYAPNKIARDSDLKSLRSDTRFQTALSRAKELAAMHAAEDIVVNSTRTGEAYRQTRMAYKSCEQNNYQEGFENAERACSMAPDDPRSHYCLACCHALLDHQESALSELEKAVELGFYCPQFISKDDDFKRFRDSKRFKMILSKARRKAQDEHVKRAQHKTRVAQTLLNRITDAVGIMDYVAVVESTEGYSTHAESIGVLVADARSRPFYPVIAKGYTLEQFDRFLPKETESFSISGGVDFGALYTFLLDTLREAGPSGEKVLTQWTAVQKQYDFDIERDLISWIGGEIINVTLEDGNSVFMVKVNDETVAREKVAKALAFSNDKLNELKQSIPPLAMLSVRTGPINHDELDGFEGIFFSMSPQPIVWGVTDGHLILSTSADSAALCLKTARGEHEGLSLNKRVMAEALVPTGPFASVSLTDQRKMGENIATGIGIASMMTAMGGSFVPDPQIQPYLNRLSGILAKLGPIATKINFYKSTASLTVFDGQRWHSHSVTHYKSPSELNP